MKIIIKENKKVRFSTLAVGQTFIDPEYEEGAVLMVVTPAIDIDIITDFGDGSAYCGYAVDLSSGTVVGYETAEDVIPVDVTLTAERL